MVSTGEIKCPVWTETSATACGEGGPLMVRGRNPNRKSVS